MVYGCVVKFLFEEIDQNPINTVKVFSLSFSYAYDSFVTHFGCIRW